MEVQRENGDLFYVLTCKLMAFFFFFFYNAQVLLSCLFKTVMIRKEAAAGGQVKGHNLGWDQGRWMGGSEGSRGC